MDSEFYSSKRRPKYSCAPAAISCPLIFRRSTIWPTITQLRRSATTPEGGGHKRILYFNFWSIERAQENLNVHLLYWRQIKLNANRNLPPSLTIMIHKFQSRNNWRETIPKVHPSLSRNISPISSNSSKDSPMCFECYMKVPASAPFDQSQEMRFQFENET